jgi:hypothetical protein
MSAFADEGAADDAAGDHVDHDQLAAPVGRDIGEVLSAVHDDDVRVVEPAKDLLDPSSLVDERHRSGPCADHSGHAE